MVADRLRLTLNQLLSRGPHRLARRRARPPRLGRLLALAGPLRHQPAATASGCTRCSTPTGSRCASSCRRRRTGARPWRRWIDTSLAVAGGHPPVGDGADGRRLPATWCSRAPLAFLVAPATGRDAVMTPGPSRRGEVVPGPPRGDRVERLRTAHRCHRLPADAEHGRAAAKRLAPAARRHRTSPWSSRARSQRARSTCELAGLGDRMQIDPDLAEWNYGAYEGPHAGGDRPHGAGMDDLHRRLSRRRKPDQIGARVDRVIGRVQRRRRVASRSSPTATSSACSWPAGSGCRPSHGRHFLLDTSTLSVLGYYRDHPAVRCWNAPIEEGVHAMTQFALEHTAAALGPGGKGILAADETVPHPVEALRRARDPVDAVEPAGLPGAAAHDARRSRRR